MSDDSLTTLMSRNFALVPAGSTVEAAHAAVPLGFVAVVMQGNLPVGVLTEDRLLGLEEARRPLTQYAERFFTPTLTHPDTPLTDILQGMNFSPSVRWHVVVEDGQVLGVLDPNVLFRVLSQWQQRPPPWLPEPLQTLFRELSALTLGTLLKLPGDPIQPEPEICGVCPATNPPHALKPRDLDYTNVLQPTCKTHRGTAIVWLNPCG